MTRNRTDTDYQPQDLLEGLAQGTETEVAGPLVISADGRRLRLPDGRDVTLMRRRSLRLLVLRLVEERLARPGTALRVEALLEAGWPGERMLPHAGQARVYVAISTLRRLGLSGVLQHTGGGYRLDPAREVRKG